VPVMVRVVIVDDHKMFAASLARVLDDEPDISILATAESTDACLEVMTDSVDVVLMDFRVPPADGVTATRTLLQRWPDVRVVMLTASHDEAVMTAALEAGCSGFITKSEPLEMVLRAVRGAATGESVVSPALLARLLPRLTSRPKGRNPDLTAREHQVLTLMACGGSNQAIADELGLSRDTIPNHVASILVKLGVNSKLQAVTAGIQRGLISVP
jgi:two-component system, NarL family, nitrate/nitrite response regulator NarL